MKHERVAGSMRPAILAAGAKWASGQRELVRLVREVDDTREWAAEGSASCAHWVAALLDIEACTVREWLRIGRALETLNVIDRAFEDGRLSYSKVRALTRIATGETQDELCDLAEQVPAGRLAREVATWLLRHETSTQTEARHQDARYFSHRVDVDGMVVGTFRLPPAEAATITAPVEKLVWQRRPGPRPVDAPADASRPAKNVRWPTIPQQRADALLEIVAGGGAKVITEIVMHVRADGCTLDDGTPIADSVVERIAPNAFLRVLIHDAERRPINASSRQRHPTTRQKRVLKERDRRCVDCGSTEFLQADHEPDYDQTRHTVIAETKLRCWTCHRERHERLARRKAG